MDIVWFRRDARTARNPAWAAGTHASSVCPLFVIDPGLYDAVSPRRARLLVAGLRRLDEELHGSGGRLRVEFGDPRTIVAMLAKKLGAERVHVNREVTPYGVDRDQAVGQQVDLVRHEGLFTHPPGSILTTAGEIYKMFTPFYESWSKLEIPQAPAIGGADITSNPGDGLPDTESPPIPAGLEAAEQRLRDFDERVDSYPAERNRLDLDTTSHLSVDLKYGWLSPQEIISRIGTSTEGRSAFVRQVAWRDFYGHLMAEMPYLVDEPMRPEYGSINWKNREEDFEAWKNGLTGYPFVDAGMRQLVAEGWLHNRTRLAVASFLVKDLLVDWVKGERFFRHHLIDGDVAQNVGNWQWVAGTGADAAPYFRIFNPVTQSKKFDPEAKFIRRWVPELAELPDRIIHAPWEAGPLELAGHGVTLGDDYPEPIVEHQHARHVALDAYERARQAYT